MLARLVTAPLAVLVLVPLGIAGCRVDVTLGFDDCTYDDETYRKGESFALPDGCNTCTCGVDGTVACTSMPCVLDCVAPDGAVVELGESVSVECNTCTCVEGVKGPELVCTGLICECSEEPPPCAAPPPGCVYQGPYCEGGMWTCGELVCEPCLDQPVCPDPIDPLCHFEAFCTEFGWECQEVCETCVDPVPDCGSMGLATCDGGVWVCEFNQTCFGPIPDCPPSIYPGCFTAVDCHSDGQWSCQEICDPGYCMTGEPKCPVGPPNCTYYPVCTSMDWACGESCQ